MRVVLGVRRLCQAALVAALAWSLAGAAMAQDASNDASGDGSASPVPAPAASTASSVVYAATLVKFGPTRDVLIVNLQGGGANQTLTVNDPNAPAKLAQLQPGDVVKVTVDSLTKPTTISALGEIDRPVDAGTRFGAFVLALGLAVGVAAACTRGKLLQLVIGMDGRYSNSQLQLALWFGAVAVAYLAAVFLRIYALGWGFAGGVGITTSLITMTGLSAFTFGGAKAITGQKAANLGLAPPNAPQPAPAPAPDPNAGQPDPNAGDAGNQGAQAVQAQQPPAQPAPAAAVAPAPRVNPKANTKPPNLFNDLFFNDMNQPDLGDMQMILVTVAAVVIFVIDCFHFLGSLQLATPVILPDVDTALLAGFGIGQGAYLMKKAALPLGQG